MPANIFGNRMMYQYGTEAPWHKNAFQPDSHIRLASEGLKLARIDYTVQRCPMFYTSPTTGETVPTNRIAIVRPAWDGEEEAMLGDATSDYEPLQNMEMAFMIDRLCEYWKLDTLGALGKGERLFICLDMGDAEVGGDQIKQYLFASNDHTGTGSVKFRQTKVRVVCANTFALGDELATVSVSVNHTRRVLRESELAVDIVDQLRHAQIEGLAGLDRLTKIHVSAEQVQRILDEVYADPDAPEQLDYLARHDAGELDLSDEQIARLTGLKIDTERKKIRKAEYQVAALEQIDRFNQENPQYAETAWGVFNGINTTECWRQGGTDKQLAQSILIGNRAKNSATAYRMLSQLA